MKKSTKALSAILSLSSVASIVAPVTTMAATVSSVDTLLATAAKTKTFADYHKALKEWNKLSTADQNKLAAKLIAVYNNVPQIAAISKLINDQVAIGTTANAADFWTNYTAINATVTSATDKAYLINELSGWGLKLLDKVPGYTAATDAIIAAGNKFAAKDVAGTKAAIETAKAKIALVNHAANKDYLTKTLKTDVEDKLAAYEATLAPVVDSVKALNAKDLVVDFNINVDELTAETKSNYVIKVNNATTAVAAGNYTVDVDSNDASKVNITLADSVALKNGDVVTVKVVKNVAAASTLKAMAADSTTVLPVYSDTTAPSITKVETSGNNVVVTFDDYIANGSYVAKFNGTAAGYTVLGKTLTINNVGASSLAAGSYDVSVFGVQDLVGNTASYLTKTLAITTDYTVPAFSSVKATGTYTFAVKFNKSLVAAPTVTVKKNGYNVRVDAVNLDSDTTVWNVTVHDTTSGDVKVYNDGENSAALEVAISGVKDAGNTIGAPANTTVTLTKDLTAPIVVAGNSAISGNVINVQFNEALSYLDGTKFIVTDKDGVRITGLTANLVTDTTGGRYPGVTAVALTGVTLADGTYTVNVAPGAVKDMSANEIAASSLNLTKSTTSSTDLTGVTANGTAANVITVTYPVDMADSARSAANYTLDGKSLPAGTIIYFNGNKQTVVIELPSASVAKTTNYVLGINSAVLSTGGAKVAAAYSNLTVGLQDNVKPLLVSAKKTDSTHVELTMNEAMTGTAATTWNDDFVVKVNGVQISVTGIAVSSTKLTLAVADYNVNQTVTVTVGGTNITLNTADIAGNVVTAGTIVTATN